MNTENATENAVVNFCGICGAVLSDYYFPLNGAKVCGECAENPLCELVTPEDL